MADKIPTLLTELQELDDREDHILDTLLRQGAALEASERRLNMVTVSDLHTLRDGLANLESVIDKLQNEVAGAEAAATPTLPQAPANGGAAHASPAPAPAPTPAPAPMTAAPAPAPAPAMTFDQLAARIREHDAEQAQIKSILHDRLIALGATPVDDHVPGAEAPGAAGSAPAKVTPRTFRLRRQPMAGADVKRFQRDVNHQFAAWDIDIRVGEDGVYGATTRHAARQVLRGLGVAPADYEQGITPTLRMLVREPGTRTADELARAASHAAWLTQLRKHAAGAKSKRHGPAAARSATRSGAKTTTTTAPSGGGLAAAIKAHGGRYEDVIVLEAKRHGLPVSLVCAVIECETGFKNVFGHDGVSNPIKSPAKGLLAVTEERYRLYLKHRNAHEGCQGVGPMQLTSSGLQDAADAVGGCWKPSANIRIGCEFLAGNIKRLGSTRQGVRAYNGAGAAAEHYAATVLARQQVWHDRLAGATAAAPARSHTHAASKATGPKGAPRTFALAKRPMEGSDVKRFQHDLNARFEHWKIELRVSEDGHFGPTTRHAAHQVLLGLGIAPADFDHGITPQLRSKIRNPKLRTPAEVARAKTREAYVAKLRKRTNAKGGGALRLRAYAEAKHMLDLDVRESGGNNRGSTVTEIIKANNGPGPEAWCGDFMAWCYRKAGSKAVTRSWASVNGLGGIGGIKRTKTPLKGDLVRWSFDHVGMFVAWCDSSGREVAMRNATHVKSIDGNTPRAGAVQVSDSAGGGVGIYMKVRSRTLVNDFLHVTR